MPAGLQAWDENGVMIVDLTTRLSRIVGYAAIGAGAAGSVSVDATLGRPWYFFVTGSRYPVVTINGNTISWDASGLDAVVMIYGVY